MNNIIGHEKEKEFLAGLFASGRMPSGLLFYGQKNIGKKFTAATFAASVLCREYMQAVGNGGKEADPPLYENTLYGDAGDEAAPEAVLETAPAVSAASLDFCGRCASCAAVLNGTSQNFLLVEPSGKSIKIESIHRINSFLGLAPSLGGHRFVVIDEASAMNQGAANALLKILEEPREDTVFILVTSSPGMLPPTVISRCLLLGFSPVPDNILAGIFGNKFPDMEKGVLRLYSKLAGGSYSGFVSLAEGGYLEKRNFLLNNVFKELFEAFKVKGAAREGGIAESGINPYDIADGFKKDSSGAVAGKQDVFETMLSILRDIYIYYMTKNDKLLYNEDAAREIERLAAGLNADGQMLLDMMDATVRHIEKAGAYNLNKTIALDSYFSVLLGIGGK